MLKCRCWQLEGWGCAAKARGWDSGLLSSLRVLDPSAKPIFYCFGPSSILKLPLGHHVMALLMILLKFSMAFYMRSKLCSPEYRAFPLSSIICLFLTSLAWFLTTSFLWPLTNTIFHSCQTSCSSQNVQFPFSHASVFLLTLAPLLGVLFWGPDLIPSRLWSSWTGRTLGRLPEFQSEWRERRGESKGIYKPTYLCGCFL